MFSVRSTLRWRPVSSRKTPQWRCFTHRLNHWKLSWATVIQSYRESSLRTKYCSASHSKNCLLSIARWLPQMYVHVYILLDTTDVNKYFVTTASCQQRWMTNWIHLDLFLGIEQRIMGCLVTTNHNKATVRGLVSQPITAYVGHLVSTWWLSLAETSGTSLIIWKTGI